MIISRLQNHLRQLTALITLLSACPLLCPPPAPTLSTMAYNAAGVLPIYMKNNTLYAVLGREAYGRDKGTYDAFVGKKDAHEYNPIITGARECAEEMISHTTMHLTVNQLQDYINPKKQHTTMVLAHQQFKYVLFITRFDKHIHRFFNNFYSALKNTNQFKYKEKDRIASVAWNDLKVAVMQNKSEVCACVIDPQTNGERRCMVTLRPIVGRALKPLFAGYEYENGKNRKVRFYS